MPNFFISYVRENRDLVQRLAADLHKRGAEVWVDYEALLPGDRWKDKIREGILQGDFFVACFSAEYGVREEAYMNEEILFAIERLRQSSFNRRWFIPILLTKTSIPNIRIGGGQSLHDLQWVGLYEDWDDGIEQIAKATGLSNVAPKIGVGGSSPYFDQITSQYERSYEEVRFKCNIQPDGSAMLRRELTLRAHSTIGELDLLLQAKNIHEVSLLSLSEGQRIEVKSVRVRNEERTLTASLSQPLFAGETFTILFMEAVDEGTFDFPRKSSRETDFFGYSIDFPIRHLLVSAALPSDYEPNAFDTEIRKRGVVAGARVIQKEIARVGAPRLEIDSNGYSHTLVVEVDYPLLGFTYGIRWY